MQNPPLEKWHDTFKFLSPPKTSESWTDGLEKTDVIETFFF